MAASHVPEYDLNEKYLTLVLQLVNELNNGTTLDSRDKALKTASLLEQIVSDAPSASALELVKTIKAVGKRLTAGAPQEMIAANMVRRVLKLIRDEHNQCPGEAGGESLRRIVLSAARRGTIGPSSGDLKSPTLNQIAEIQTELENCLDAIAEQTLDHINYEEVVVTYGATALAERLFERAALTKTFTLIIVDDGQAAAMAARLPTEKLTVVFVPLESGAAIMSRCTKFIVGAHCVLADGTVMLPAGSKPLIHVSQDYNLPVIVLCPLFHLTPMHSSDPRFVNELITSNELDPDYESDMSDMFLEYPKYDLIPPDLVTLFSTNLGGNSPAHVYRLMRELYDTKDTDV